MGVVVGIDVGGSTTKICGFNDGRELIEPVFVRATDPTTSVFGAFGKFTQANALRLEDIERVMITGVGAACIQDRIYDLPCEHAAEFQCVGLGGLYLTGLSDAIVVSMGTGTALAHAYLSGMEPKVDYLGGTGVGGGTLLGLSKAILGMDTVTHIVDLAKDGNIHNIDLQIGDIAKDDISLPKNMTASNFGKCNDVATRSDMALGILNMVFETVGMMSIFGARSSHIKDIVLTGNLTNIPQAKETFDTLSGMFDVHFTMPRFSQFATVIGTALSYLIRKDGGYRPS